MSPHAECPSCPRARCPRGRWLWGRMSPVVQDVPPPSSRACMLDDLSYLQCQFKVSGSVARRTVKRICDETCLTTVMIITPSLCTSIDTHIHYKLTLQATAGFVESQKRAHHRKTTFSEREYYCATSQRYCRSSNAGYPPPGP